MAEEDLEVLPELEVTDEAPLEWPAPPISSGSAYGYQQNIENEYSWPTWYYTDANTIVNPGLEEAFAPPMPEVLPEVVVTPKPEAPVPRVVAPAPVIGAALPIVPILTIVGAGINLAMEQFRRPDVEAEQPVLVPKTELEVLPEVQVVATRPPRPPTSFPPLAMPADPWPFNVDPLEYYPELPGQRPFLPLPGAEPRPGDVQRSPKGIPGAPGLDPGLEVAPRPGTAPQPRPGSPDVVLAPMPGIDTGPGFDPGFAPFPSIGTGPGPGTAPAPIIQPFPSPVEMPWPDLFADTPILPGLRSPSLPMPSAPSLPRISDPVTFLDPMSPLTQPDMQRPPTKTDHCNCAKEKKKPKKKREPRAVCYRGTYTETSKSLHKVRRERIPCS